MENKFTIKDMNLYYGSFHALKSVDLNLPANEVTAFIGPSGCGKSTLLRSLNRMNDLVEGVRLQGIFVWTTKIFMVRWTSTYCGNGWVWCFRRQTLFR